MTRIHVFQIAADQLFVANKSLLSALLQDVILGISVSAAVELGFYRHAFTIETTETGDTALESAWFAAQDVAMANATIITRAEGARQSAKTDLFVVEGGDAFIAQGSWFSPYSGQKPTLATDRALAAA